MEVHSKREGRRPARLSADMERAVIYGLQHGTGLDATDSRTLSRLGGVVLQAVRTLHESGAKPPFAAGDIGSVAASLHGGSSESIVAYLRECQGEPGFDPQVILQKVKQKEALLGLINQAGEMLQSGDYDVGRLADYISTVRDGAATNSVCLPVCEVIKDGLPPVPEGLKLSSLKKLSEVTGGIIDMWAVGGEPGIGKSTFAWQLAIDVGRKYPVLFYSLETPFNIVIDRTRQCMGGNVDSMRKLLRNVYFRDSLKTLEADLATVKPPALVAVDYIQQLSGMGEDRRGGIDRWLLKLEALVKRGYYVLFVSEIGRGFYEAEARLNSFKESGSIEYKAGVAMQLLPVGADTLEVAIVKNRHRPFKGTACYLARKNGWWFREAE